jgi:tetratricopeptide (TPR) repeat protein/anti-sigma regulatory factor (Ser/Thr protein kinase)
MFGKTIIMVLIACSVGYAQQPSKKDDRKESQPSKLKSYRTRGSSSDNLLKDAEREAEKDPSAALDKVQEALAESIAQENTANEARSYLLLGDINTRIPEWKLAAQNYEKAYNILKTMAGDKFSQNQKSSQSNKVFDPTTDEFMRALGGLAKSNLESGNYQASISNYQEILDQNGLPSSQYYRAKLGLSEAQYRLGQYEESLKIAQTIPAQQPSPKSSPAQDDVSSEVQNMLAKNYAKLNDVEQTQKAIGNSLNSLRASDAAPSSQGYAQLEETKTEVANTLREQGHLDDEIALRNQSIEFNLEKNNLGEVAKDKVELSKSLEAKGARAAALKELIEAAALVDTLDDPREQANAYLSLAGLYEKNGENSNALGAYRKYSEAVKKSGEQAATKMEERSILIKKQTDIDELSTSLYIDRSEDNAQKAVIARQQIIITSLIVILVIIGVTSVFIYRSAQSSKKANQLLALKSLRSQMNPHFIFNALNSVNHFIAQQDERTANKFLSEFSQLMRLVLEYSQEDFITLQKEQEILALYMKLEHYRFRDKFEYEIDIDGSINAESVLVPPMLIQPYIENAVWHGLRYRETVGHLKLTMVQENGSLVVTISDNGIGRKRSEDLKTENQKKHKSTGLKNIRERLLILNHVYRTHYEVNVSDGPGGEGTMVQIKIPTHNSRV